MTLRCTGLHVTGGDRTLLPPTDLELAAGETLAVVGPSGAGKTSVLTVLGGLLRPAAGTVTLDDIDVLRVPRNQIGVVTSPVLLAATLSVAENIGIPLQAAGWEPDAIRQRVNDLLERLALDGVADRESSRLSGGQRQRVAVARAVAPAPPLIIADEPTSELDHDSRERVLALVRTATASGSIVVLSTNDESVAEIYSHVIRLGPAAVT
ncbi:MAG TPA: ATP-binding cassette domain-containing protein [Mycobacteriales bacterium]|nr:ATP-binding cassette domain-containing protein [Mycobacteriales bacterium]